MKSIKDEGLITQLAVVATMMPKVKAFIDEQLNQCEMLEAECKALREQLNELQ